MPSSRIRGRPPTLFDKPEGALARFGWICRVLREYSGDPEIQHTGIFARLVSARLTEDLKPATINRMETGTAHFTADRIGAYEELLCLEQGTLFDTYIYLTRLEVAPGQGVLRPPRITDAAFFDLSFRVASDDPTLTAYDYLIFALALGASDRRKCLSAKRVRDHLATRLLDHFASAFERDERLLREAIILLAECVAPHIVERVKGDPIRLFNVVEALGFAPGKSAWRALLQLAAGLSDDVQAQTLIEPIRRWVRIDHERLEHICEAAPHLIAYCEEVVQAPAEAYTTREEALAFLVDARIKPTPRVMRYFNECRDEINQLRGRPVGTSRRDIAIALHERTQRQLMSRGVTGRHGATRDIPGLKPILEDALFAANRVDRLGISLALGALPIKADLCHAAGNMLLHDISADNYGIQRSVIRFMTKLGDPAAHSYFSRFGKQDIRDDGVRLSIAWALGTGSGRTDEQCLRKVKGPATVTTRRVIALAAARREYRNLLCEMLSDPNSTVRGEAAAALKALPKLTDAPCPGLG